MKPVSPAVVRREAVATAALTTSRLRALAALALLGDPGDVAPLPRYVPESTPAEWRARERADEAESLADLVLHSSADEIRECVEHTVRRGVFTAAELAPVLAVAIAHTERYTATEARARAFR